MVVLALIPLLLLLALGVICALKGKWVFFLLGFVAPGLWMIGASRLGKPDSPWARRVYEPLEVAEAERRFSRNVIPRWGGSPWRDGVTATTDAVK